jgi:xanthine dehydrogenase large subunit
MTVKNKDSYTHVRGESLFVDDLSEWQGTLYASVLDATHAHARIISVDDTLAVALPGVAKIISYKDIKGENQIGGIIPDEPLLAEDLVHFQGMPIALILADTQAIAHKARKLIKVQYEDLPVITTAREAFEKGQFTNGPRTFVKNDIVNGFAQSDYIFEGEVFTNGQEHLYLETQGAYALPMENEAIKVVSSTQGPTSVQKAIAKVLGVGMHQIEVEVNRLGGGFGGKEDQATAWAALAALGCQLTGKPVKLILDR